VKKSIRSQSPRNRSFDEMQMDLHCLRLISVTSKVRLVACISSAGSRVVGKRSRKSTKTQEGRVGKNRQRRARNKGEGEKGREILVPGSTWQEKNVARGS